MSNEDLLHARVHQALKDWHDMDAVSPLSKLLAVRNLCAHGSTPRLAVNQLLLNLLSRMDNSHPEYATVLRLRFLENMQPRPTANRINLTVDALYPKQRKAIALLASWVEQEEEKAQTKFAAIIEGRLEIPTYERLFGVEEHLTCLQDLLEQDGPPWLLLLTGIGGIGKTALTDALLRRTIRANYFVDFAWTTARQQQLQLDGAILPVVNPTLTPAALMEDLARQLLGEVQPSLLSQERLADLLTARLKSEPHLVVVDNLETVQDVMALLPLLRQMATPTKFVLTSRPSLPAAAYLHAYSVPLLEWVDSLALVRWEAAQRNLPQIVNASDQELHPIFATVGGNPLALRLVVGQTHDYSLDVVLQKLKAAQGASIEALFRYIYRWAWELLDDNAQELFLSLPLLPEEGADLAFLGTTSGLNGSALYDALEKLLRLNLVDHRSHSLRRSVYTIHSLTRTFLLQDLVRWPR